MKMKYCTKCGTPIDQGENFCTQCGAPVQRREEVDEREKSFYGRSAYSETNQENPFVYDSSENSNGAAVASLVLGILSLVFSLGIIAVPLAGLLSGVCAVVGIILGASGRKKQFRQGMATAGLICSVIALVLSIIGLVSCVACAGCLGLSALSL